MFKVFFLPGEHLRKLLGNNKSQNSPQRNQFFYKKLYQSLWIKGNQFKNLFLRVTHIMSTILFWSLNCFMYVYVCLCVCRPICIYIHTYINKYLIDHWHKFVWICFVWGLCSGLLYWFYSAKRLIAYAYINSIWYTYLNKNLPTQNNVHKYYKIWKPKTNYVQD